jgi:hypothetical protein
MVFGEEIASFVAKKVGRLDKKNNRMVLVLFLHQLF